jgi:hypothetical protein
VVVSSRRIGSAGMDRIRAQLDDRALAIVRQVADLRLMSADQIASIYFLPGAQESASSAQRTCRRVLARLADQQALIRTSRRIGGVRAGSSGFIYALGTIGQRLIGAEGPRRRFREPSATFADHTLAVSQLVVDLTVASGSKGFDLLEVEAEPTCWRVHGGLTGRQTLRPDLFVSLGVGSYECRYFIEVDRGTEHLPALLRKCRGYDAYYHTGTEQAVHGVFPRVAWIVPDDRRADLLERAIQAGHSLTSEMFLVTVPGSVISLLSGDQQ